MTTDRDPQVGALLDLLEPVAPRPGFWDDLEARLRSEPSPVVALARVPGGAAARRAEAARRRRVVLGLAAAAAAVTALVGSLALRDDGRERGETVPVQEGSSTTTPTTTEPTTEATYADDAPQLIALNGADLWIEATQSGDDELAWALLGGQSRAQLGSQAALADLPLEEDWAPYVDSPDRDELVLPLGGDLWMIVLTVESESDVLPPKVIVVEAPPASEYSVEVFLPGTALGLIGVQLGTPLPRESTIPVAVDASASTYMVIIDGIVFDGATTDGSEDADHLPWLERDVDGAVTGVRPQPALEVGVHWIAVLQIVDGVLAADARAFQVGSGAG